MNRDDIMNALSGLDPKYIDEAAFELHGNTVSFENAKKARARRNFLIALPAAAAAFILIGVMLLVPTMRKLGTSESAAVSSDAAAPAPAEAAEEAPSFAAEAASDAAPAYEAEEAAEPEAPIDAYEEAAQAPEAAGEVAKSFENAAEAAAETEEAKAPLFPEGSLGLKRATWYDGRLVVRMSEEVPSNIASAGYSVTGTNADGSGVVLTEGILGDVLVKEDPLTLDLSDLGLEAGTYTLKIGEEEIEFTI